MERNEPLGRKKKRKKMVIQVTIKIIHKNQKKSEKIMRIIIKILK